MEYKKQIGLFIGNKGSIVFILNDDELSNIIQYEYKNSQLLLYNSTKQCLMKINTRPFNLPLIGMFINENGKPQKEVVLQKII